MHEAHMNEGSHVMHQRMSNGESCEHLSAISGKQTTYYILCRVRKIRGKFDLAGQNFLIDAYGMESA